MKVDQFGSVFFSEQEVCELLYINNSLNIANLVLEDPDRFNHSNRVLHAGLPKLQKYIEKTESVEEFDRRHQASWFTPQEYQSFDIESWLFEQCSKQEQKDRVATELSLFKATNLLELLKYVKYLVDVMNKNNIVWGVGRGSSTASYVLYLIGLHLIDPLKYNIPIEEFFKQGATNE